MNEMNAALRLATPSPPDIVPVQRLPGRVAGVYAAPDADDLASAPLEALRLELAGLPGDRHHGFTRPSGSREPWYPRGTEIRSGRQLSIVSVEELAEIARRMGLPELRPEWIGANIMTEGVPRLSLLPPGTRLFFEEQATVVIELPNGPCRDAGRSIQRHFPERRGIELDFPKHAKQLRGVAASVERAGQIRAGASFEARIPEQIVYRA